MANLPDDPLDDYLDHVCAPLVGVVPYPRRTTLRYELREHVTMLTEDGQTLEEVLRSLGDPYEAGRRFLAQWEAQSRSRGPSHWVRRDLSVAIGYLGAASAAALLFDLSAHYGTPRDSFSYGAALSQFGWLAAVPYGWRHPANGARSVAIASLALGLHALVVAALVGRDAEDFHLHALYLFTLWPLLGSISATLSAEQGRRIRNRRFWRQRRLDSVASPSLNPLLLEK